MPKSPTKKIQHAWSLLASGVSVDQESNNLTLFNVIDQIAIPKNQLAEMPTLGGERKPAIPIGFIFTTQWIKLKDGGNAKAEAKIELLDPVGTVRQKVDYSITLPEKVERLRSRVQWNGLRVTTSGMYVFKISIKEENQKEFEHVGDVYLKVELTEETPSQKESKKKS